MTAPLLPSATITAALSHPALFGPWFSGSSWDAWRSVLKGAFGEPMTGAERDLFRTVADRDPPAARVRELWAIVGRRGGKDSIAATAAAYVAALGNYDAVLRPGEMATILCLAVDRQQGQLVLRYIKGFFSSIPALGAMITRETADGIELNNRTEIIVGTNDFRMVRGRTLICAILDECAYYRSDTAANPDAEVYGALVPALATIPGALLIGISSPYRRAGLLFNKWQRHYGQDGDVLVIRAPSRTMNPTIPQQIVDDALEADPQAAAAEWMAEWRSDIAAFVTREVIDAVTVPGRFELPPMSGLTYRAHVDPSGGSADSFTMAIGHQLNGVRILDAVREVRPPFSPEAVIADFAALLKTYRVSRVTGDRYGGEFPRELFRKHGITYDLSDRPASDIYRDALPLLNSGKVELLDVQRLSAQLAALERRTARSGKDLISHPPGGHDDVANSACGALLLCGSSQPLRFTEADLAKIANPNYRPSNGAGMPVFFR